MTRLNRNLWLLVFWGAVVLMLVIMLGGKS
jgi:hypothetical protein